MEAMNKALIMFDTPTFNSEKFSFVEHLPFPHNAWQSCEEAIKMIGKPLGVKNILNLNIKFFIQSQSSTLRGQSIFVKWTSHFQVFVSKRKML